VNWSVMSDVEIIAALRDRAGKYDEYDYHGDLETEAAKRIESLLMLNFFCGLSPTGGHLFYGHECGCHYCGAPMRLKVELKAA
jgi:hypothetical protein